KTLKTDVHLLYIAIALGVAAAIFNLSTAVFSQVLIDDILPGKDRGRLLPGLLILGLLLGVKTILSYRRQCLLNRQGYQFNTRLTGGFYSAILFLNKSFFDNRKTGDLIARLNDTLRIQQAVSYILGDMAIQLLMLVASLFFLFLYSWTIGLLSLVTVAAVYGVVKYFEPGIVRQQRDVMKGYAQNESNYVDSIRGIHTIKVMNRENIFIHLARSIFSAFQGAIWKLGKTRARFNATLEVVTILFLLAITGLSAIKVLTGSLKTGELIAVLQIAGLLMQATMVVALTSLQVQEAKVALDRMYEFTVVEPEYKTNKRSQNTQLQFGSLSVKHLAFRFPGKKMLLKDVSLEARKGEIIAITGESGMGKSTLF
ncbi:MAG TPA: ABC transporter transmembrane domain-containing protein, partial [Chitinophagaceae bacterium]|nr:ABC transporter transmembrane domain-containing protein [Chitinophagaceae bacterium]